MENFGFNPGQESVKHDARLFNIDAIAYTLMREKNISYEEAKKEAIKELKDSDIEEAESEILYIRQNIQTMGANDSEMPLISNLLIDLKSGKVLPEEAIRRANEILSSKQDYH